MKNEDTYWTTIITPKISIWDLDLKELWAKKYLLWLFIRRDLIVQFKQTIFGIGWYFISPLFSTFMYIVVFSKVAHIPTDEIPQPLFYLSGICLWEYFSTCLMASANALQVNSSLFSKVYFPRLIAPLSLVLGKLFRFAIQLSMFVLVYVACVYKGAMVRPNVYLLLFPLLVLILQMMSFGLGLIVSSLTTKYRDLGGFFGVFVSLWMYATPIIYPLSYVTDARLRVFMDKNPLTAIIEAFKYGTMGAGSFSWSGLGYSFAVSLGLLVVGLLLFNRKQKNYLDTI